MVDTVKATLVFPDRTYECEWPLDSFNAARAAQQIGFEARTYARRYEHEQLILAERPSPGSCSEELGDG